MHREIPESASEISTVQVRLIEWWQSSPERQRAFPWRRKRISKYQALVTEVLLQRTRATAVCEIYDDFFSRFPDAESLGRARVQTIRKAIEPLGLSWRAEKLKALGKALSGGVPDDYQALISLPGIGPYAAAAYLSLHRGERAVIVDANVVRILGRIFGFDYDPETRRKKAFINLCEAVTPRNDFGEFNYALIDFGREICLPVNPACQGCFINDLCAESTDSGG